ncbi:esterase/lipase family protein [Nocardiopsis sediminis]|uniref:Esterase/lipase family protein n=1 Tax=Nocardiopsis sediminis TaxID=1778267 RepID=A0ABV8FHX0_9ACTN
MRRIASLLCGLAAAATALSLTPAAAAQVAAATPDPVVFVHGFAGKGSQWSAMRDDFQANGYPADRLHVFTYNSAQSNVTTADDLAAFVAEVRSTTGAAKVDIVTHSMGGLPSRWYVKFLGGTDTVDDWVSIGGPNNGTRVAGLCSIALPSCQEMEQGSSFLSELNAGDPTPGGVAYTTFRSPCDIVIQPVSSTVLDGATNNQTGCLEHISMMSNGGVIDGVRDAIA